MGFRRLAVKKLHNKKPDIVQTYPSTFDLREINKLVFKPMTYDAALFPFFLGEDSILF